MTSMHHFIRDLAIAGSILSVVCTVLAGALMANGYLHLWGFEIFNVSGMIPAWLFTKGDHFTSEAEHALYAIPFSLVINVVPGAVLGALVGTLMSTKAKASSR